MADIYQYLTQDLYALDDTESPGSGTLSSSEINSVQGGDGTGETYGDEITTGDVDGNLSFTGGFIQSSNFVTGSTGWRISADGSAEFDSGYFRGDITGASGTFSGTITGGSLNIPDTTTASSFHVDTSGNAWWGTNVATGFATAPAKILATGAATFSSVTITGGTISGTPISGIPNNASTDISLLEYTHDLVFSVTDADTVAWTSGTITMSNGRTFSISSGNTGNMTVQTFIYLDTGASTTALQTTTAASTAMGANKILISVAQNGAGQPTFQVYGGAGGLKLNSNGINIANNNWTYTGAFSASSATVVAWASGTLKTSDGTAYSISGGNTGTMAALTYIYFDLGASSTVFQTTTTATGAIGDGKILISAAQNNTTEAVFQVFGGRGGNNLDGSSIVTASITSNELGAGSVISSKGNLALRGWTQTCAFTVASATQVNWGSGTFTASDGTSYSITGSNTGTMSLKTYIYLDIAISTTAYQTTTTAGTAIGDGKVLVAIAQNATTEATFFLLNNNSYNIDAANIVAGSITANEIAAATITGAKIAATTITASNIVSGTITSTQIAATTILAGNIVAGTITGNEIAASTITAAKISVSQLSAISADLGAITAGSITINGGVASISSLGAAVFKSIQVGGSSVLYTLNDSGIFSFGDGSDGAAVFDGVNTFGFASLVGSTYTLTRDVNLTNMTINISIIVNPAGYRIFGTGTATITGNIVRNGVTGGNGGNGGNGAGGSSGTAGATASLADGFLKGAALTGAGGTRLSGGSGIGGNGTAVSACLIPTVNGADGGAGGASGASAGFAKGNGGTTTQANVKLTASWHLQTLLDISSSGATVKYNSTAAAGGGGSGGQGSNGAGGGGGGGGSNGGIISMYFRKIILTGIISGNGANGGNGGNGGTNNSGSNGTAGGGGGGGGAGNGGIVILVYNLLTNSGSITVNAGTGGTGGAKGIGIPTPSNDGFAGANGSAGSSGAIYLFNLSL